jgi:hypothetical protein
LCISDSSSREPPTVSTYRDVSDSGKQLPSNDEMERLARRDPIAFLEMCIRRYDREVKSYTAILKKQERIDGKLERSELIDIAFREDPFSVLMRWKEGARRADALLYVKGENGNQLLIHPTGVFSVAGIVSRDPYGTDAKKGGRYALPEFGIKIGMQRTLASWERARKANALHIEYLGIKRVKEAGNLNCWVLKRTDYAKPEDDGIRELTTYIDTENWLQLGTVLKGEEGKLIGEYFFRNVTLNPEFKPGTFSRDSLK